MSLSKKELNDVLVELFNSALKLEERSLKDMGVNDLSMSEIHVIEAIFQTQEKTMTNVAAKLDITPGTLTTSVDKLIKKGYVIKKVSKLDKRIHLLQLTSNSIEVLNKHSEFHNELIEALYRRNNDYDMDAFLNAVKNINEFFVSLK